MPIPATNPVRKNIRDAVLYALRNRIVGAGQAIRYSDGGDVVVADGGYYNTMRAAFDPPRTIEQMNEFPCANVFIDNEVCSNVDNVLLDQNQAALHNRFTLKMDVFLNNINDPATAQDKILADIQKYFGINYYIPDSSGARTCFNCYYDRSDPFGTNGTRPNCGIEIDYVVWYRQKLTDPTQNV